MNNNKRKIYWLLIPLLIYFSFGFYHLAHFETADEHFWIYDPLEGRIHDYWRALADHDLKATRINDKPGVTLAYVSGIGEILQKNPIERIIPVSSYLKSYNPSITENINLVFRLPILLFNGFFIFFFYWIIKKLTDSEWIALLSSSFILLNPILLGISQIVNPDSLLWVFANASFLSFLVYLKEEKKKYAILTSLFLGLALLSKYAAVLFIPFFALVMVSHFLIHSTDWQKENVLHQKVIQLILTYFFIVLGSLVVFSILMPAVFSDITFLYEGTIGFRKNNPLWIFGLFLGVNVLLLIDAWRYQSKYLKKIVPTLSKVNRQLPRLVFAVLATMFILVLINWFMGNNFLDIKGVQFDAGKGKEFRRQDLFLDQIFLELYPLVFSLTPLILMSIIFYWIKSTFKETVMKKWAFFLSCFLIVFYAAVLQQQLLVNIRYSVMLYPILMILAALGVYELFQTFKLKEITRLIIFSGLIITSFLSLWLIKPYYFNYTNDFLPKSRIITGAWGYGGWEAAQYLNSLPNAKNLVVWADYWGFCPFFKGVCIKTSEVSNPNLRKDKVKIDYFVVSRKGSGNHDGYWNALQETAAENPVWKLEIDGRSKNFIYVYKADYNFFEITQENKEKENESANK